MNRIVLDASAILAILNRESGASALTPELLSGAVCSAVNASEVHGKLVNLGLAPREAWEAALSPVQEIIDFNAEHARTAGEIVKRTKRYGLSLGDRACLALGLALNAPVYTADRLWKKIKLGVRIHVIR